MVTRQTRLLINQMVVVLILIFTVVCWAESTADSKADHLVSTGSSSIFSDASNTVKTLPTISDISDESDPDFIRPTSTQSRSAIVSSSSSFDPTESTYMTPDGHDSVKVTNSKKVETTEASALAPKSDSRENQPAVFQPIRDEQWPPSITYPYTSATVIVFGHEKNNFMIQCKATGYPKPKFRWYRNGDELNEAGTFIQAYINGSLVFPKFSDRESGWYQCKASNVYGVSVSNVFYLVEETSSLSVDAQPTKDTVSEWDPYRVPCNGIPVTYPKARIRWFNKDNDQITYNERIGQDEEGTLYLAYVTMNDNNQIFRCALVSSSTRTISMTDISTLKVESAPSVTKKPTLQYSSKYVEATKGYDVTLDCFMAGKPLSKITWKNSSNHEISEQGNPRFRIHDHGRKLQVRRVDVNDEGAFTCTGTNIGGKTEAQIFVNVTSPPLPIQGGALYSQTFPDKTDVTLHCQAQVAPGEVYDTPVWYRNGQLLNQVNVPDANRYTFSNDMGTLSIKQLDKQADTACYQCNITNSKGFLYFDAFLRVIDSIQIQRKPAEVIAIETDDVIDLTIRAIGDGCCRINTLWYFNGTQIDVNKPPFRVNTTTSSLYFDAGSVSIETLRSMLGEYTCRVSNSHQSLRVDVLIKFKNDDNNPKPVTEEKAKAGLWWIGLIAGLAVVIIAVLFVLYVAYKRKNPGETYNLGRQELKHNLNPEEDLLNQSFQEI